MPLHSVASIKQGLDQYADDQNTLSPPFANLASVASNLAQTLPAKDRVALKSLIAASPIRLQNLRSFLIRENHISLNALNSLAAAIEHKATTLQNSKALVKVFEESRPAHYKVLQPGDEAKQWLANKYRQKYGLDLFIEFTTLTPTALKTLIEEKLNDPHFQIGGLVMQSHALRLKETQICDDYSGHVTPFVIQKTAAGFDLICLDSVSQPETRIFECCTHFVNQGMVIRTVICSEIRQADGYSCHTDALQVLKDVMTLYGKNNQNLLEALKPMCTEMPAILNPISPALPKPLALPTLPLMQKVAQKGNVNTTDPRYRASFKNGAKAGREMNQFLLIKGYYNALKFLAEKDSGARLDPRG